MTESIDSNDLNTASVTPANVDFRDRLKSLNERWLETLRSSLREVSEILNLQTTESSACTARFLGSGYQTPSTLTGYGSERAELSLKALTHCVSRWETTRPYRNSLASIEEYDRNLIELVRIGSGTSETEITRAIERRSKATERFLSALALSLRQIVKNWELVRTPFDALIVGRRIDPQRVARSNEQLAKQNTARLESRAGKALDELSKWSEALFARLSGTSQKSITNSSAGPGTEAVSTAASSLRPPSDTEELTASDAGRRIEHWAEQSRSLEAELRMARSLDECENHIIALTGAALDSCRSERAAISSELFACITWIRQRMTATTEGDITPVHAEVVPAPSRLAELRSRYKTRVEALPESLPALRESNWQFNLTRSEAVFRPRASLAAALAKWAEPEFLKAFQHVESEHRRMVQEIERAREVVRFAHETAKSDSAMMQEALTNALSLLQYQAGAPPGNLDWAESRVLIAIAHAFEEAHLILQQDRLGILTYLAQQGTTKGLKYVSSSSAALAQRTVKATVTGVDRLRHDVLNYIGLEQHLADGKSEVIARSFLPQEFTVDLQSKQLPQIYRRLFRFEPVDDARFLVGRETELAAISDARDDWESGRSVSLIVAGERGSGKTSLINCAVRQSLSDLSVLRGEFNRRITTEAELRESLASLVGVSDPSKLEAALNAERRVVIIEELERAFLRQVGYFGAIRALQKIIFGTCRSTFWIVATNQVAFRFLDASTRLAQSFSHRINAANAGALTLREGILRRHYLSGLRLRFGDPPVTRKRERRITGKLNTYLGVTTDAEDIFFRSLAEESDGVFRTAFEIWLGQIDAAEAGTLFLKPITPPNLSGLVDDLDMDDLFTLVAILQHGSLTPDEHSLIFQGNQTAGKAQLDELVSRELVEAESGGRGFRVRPEALRLVRHALYMRNML